MGEGFLPVCCDSVLELEIPGLPRELLLPVVGAGAVGTDTVPLTVGLLLRIESDLCWEVPSRSLIP